MSDQAIALNVRENKTNFSVLWAASFCHLLNDMLQALLPAVYPILQGGFNLTFAQVGVLTFCYQLTASIFQPFIGHYTDRRPMPYSLPAGMAASMAGLLTLAFAPNYGTLWIGGTLLGLGSSIILSRHALHASPQEVRTDWPSRCFRLEVTLVQHWGPWQRPSLFCLEVKAA